jgi:predicted lactoylglutathione lyase
MATEADVKALLDQVKSGSTFDALRASEQLAKIGRNRRKSTDELLREAVEAGAEAVRHNKQLDVDEIVRDVKQRAGWPQ